MPDVMMLKIEAYRRAERAYVRGLLTGGALAIIAVLTGAVIVWGAGIAP